MDECRTPDDFAALLETSLKKPVFLLKHSTRCPISRAAFSEFKQIQADSTGAEFWQVMALGIRDLSAAIAESTGIDHGSPQAILFRGGKAVWNASHYDIDVESMHKALSRFGK